MDKLLVPVIKCACRLNILHFYRYKIQQNGHFILGTVALDYAPDVLASHFSHSLYLLMCQSSVVSSNLQVPIDGCVANITLGFPRSDSFDGNQRNGAPGEVLSNYSLSS